jgi:hypothetical protein
MDRGRYHGQGAARRPPSAARAPSLPKRPIYPCAYLRQLSRYSSPKCHASGQSRRLNPRFAGRSVNSLVAPPSQVSLPLSSSPLRHGNPRGRPKGSSLTLLSRHYPVLASLPAGSNPSPLAYPTPLAQCGGTCTNTFWTHVPVSIGALPSGASTR